MQDDRKDLKVTCEVELQLRTKFRRAVGGVAESLPPKPVLDSRIVSVDEHHVSPISGRGSRRGGVLQSVEPKSITCRGHIESERVWTVDKLRPLTQQPVVFFVLERFRGTDADFVYKTLPSGIPGRPLIGGKFMEFSRAPNTNRGS